MSKPSFSRSDFLSIGDFEGDDSDFVFVEKDFGVRTTDDGGSDADSYDYCDDVCSVSSSSEEHETNGSVLLLSDSIDDEITSPVMGLKDSTLTVPLGLLKDLDEAHEAAKLTRISDLEETTDLVTACSDDCGAVEEGKSNSLTSSPHKFVSEKPKAEKTTVQEDSLSPTPEFIVNDGKNGCIGIESSASLSVSTKPDNGAIRINGISTSRNRAILILPAANIGMNPFPGDITLPAPCSLNSNFLEQVKKDRTNKAEKQSEIDKNTGSGNNASKATPVPISVSRTSNKKRRKKLKLLKKAQAAEKFKQQAAFANHLSSPSQGKGSKKFLKRSNSSSKKQHHVTPSRCASKRVANIAVSCAIESMSSYREELSRQRGKQ